jgi:hypothetical protein
MAQVKKRKLSGSTDGRQIKIVATGTPGTLVHTAVASTAAGTWDEIWLYLTNTTATDVQVQVELGGTTSPDDRIVVTIPGAAGRVLVLDGAILQNGAILRVWAGTANVINASGFVNQMSE